MDNEDVKEILVSMRMYFFSAFFFFFFFGHAHGMQKFLGRGLNPRHSRDNVGSLTHCTTRELPSCVSQTFFQGQSGSRHLANCSVS